LRASPFHSADCFQYRLILKVIGAAEQSGAGSRDYKRGSLQLALAPDSLYRENGSKHMPTFKLSPWNAIMCRVWLGN